MAHNNYCALCGQSLGVPPTVVDEIKGSDFFNRNLRTLRITRERMFLEIAAIVRKRSTCLRGKVGCVIVQDDRIVSLGYNGSPPGAPHCFDLGCDVDENVHEAGCQRTIHAEHNAILWAARSGTKVEGATMYATHNPCLKCAQAIVMAGIVEVNYLKEYRLGRNDILADAGVGVHPWGVFSDILDPNATASF